MKRTELQRFDTVQIKRSEIKLHPKNPRQIDESARKRLKGKMQQVGLLQPLIVNKGTMHLLGGHQRLSVMDSIERYKEGKNDYLLDVAMVDLPEKEELEMLVFLNNPSAQGTWDSELLAEINAEFGVSFDDMGFDALDVDMLFDGDSRFSELFADSQEVKEAKDSLAEIKAHRKESTERMKEEQTSDWIFTVVCRSEKEKRDWLKKMRIPAHERFISGDALVALERVSGE